MGAIFGVLIGFFVFCAFCGMFADNPGIIGSIANLLWYIWRKLWGLVVIIAIIWIGSILLDKMFV